MKWKFVKPLRDAQQISKFEETVEYLFPQEFKEVVKQFNGGFPEKNTFDISESEECDFNNLLSFNKKDRGSIWNLVDRNTTKKQKWSVEGLPWKYVPFASDSFGDFICFDRSNNHIVLWDHETGKIEEVAKDFLSFLESLYEFDEEAIIAKYLN